MLTLWKVGWASCDAVIWILAAIHLTISSDNIQGRLYYFGHQSGVILRDKAIKVAEHNRNWYSPVSILLQVLCLCNLAYRSMFPLLCQFLFLTNQVKELLEFYAGAFCVNNFAIIWLIPGAFQFLRVCTALLVTPCWCPTPFPPSLHLLVGQLLFEKIGHVTHRCNEQTSDLTAGSTYYMPPYFIAQRCPSQGENGNIWICQPMLT